ncbi:uncharacterized protein LACBIDRAFT_325824 [Laccaria bicolor S238N-H82]|uniref:Predicted protein n=1 Tax=Laccaria bicolor (strain S238N-H82 / ATCC MYA-4686) TaxID=486041 RepID=B0D6C7_LACBS|nr:uncharacterized protein LACBIDRAFT_325824 [Laccaria bicolor S238N-H82]EDR09925.1 predicted protein [Laccaria bicolor S238N-H82]|eukprot:XP_001879310.1 predicted protein [Laccaria bicolor S238N-H82]
MSEIERIAVRWLTAISTRWPLLSPTPLADGGLSSSKRRRIFVKETRCKIGARRPMFLGKRPKNDLVPRAVCVSRRVNPNNIPIHRQKSLQKPNKLVSHQEALIKPKLTTSSQNSKSHRSFSETSRILMIVLSAQMPKTNTPLPTNSCMSILSSLGRAGEEDRGRGIESWKGSNIRRRKKKTSGISWNGNYARDRKQN